MRRLAWSTVVCIVALGAPGVAAAQNDFVLIVNRANPVTTVRQSEASKLFLRKQTRWPNGNTVQAVDQIESSSVRRKFSDAVLRMDVPSVKSYWQELVFAGRSEPPPERAADADVIAFVRANPNAIGYISRATPPADVKPIVLIP